MKEKKDNLPKLSLKILIKKKKKVKAQNELTCSLHVLRGTLAERKSYEGEIDTLGVCIYI